MYILFVNAKFRQRVGYVLAGIEKLISEFIIKLGGCVRCGMVAYSV